MKDVGFGILGQTEIMRLYGNFKNLLALRLHTGDKLWVNKLSNSLAPKVCNDQLRDKNAKSPVPYLVLAFLPDKVAIVLWQLAVARNDLLRFSDWARSSSWMTFQVI